MTIQVGDEIPAGKFSRLTGSGMEAITTDDLFAGKKTVLFALPGAFTPTCSAKHVPSFLTNYDALKAKGVDTIACLSVNDAFVMAAWSKDQGADDKIVFLADGNAEFTKALGLDADMSNYGMGVRAKRFALIAEDGVVTTLNIEGPGAFEVSSGDAILKAL
jgi:peroxiredoxin (alkyl hydroperoxide reductase subunit C)